MSYCAYKFLALENVVIRLTTAINKNFKPKPNPNEFSLSRKKQSCR